MNNRKSYEGPAVKLINFQALAMKLAQAGRPAPFRNCS